MVVFLSCFFPQLLSNCNLLCATVPATRGQRKSILKTNHAQAATIPTVVIGFSNIEQPENQRVIIPSSGAGRQQLGLQPNNASLHFNKAVKTMRKQEVYSPPPKSLSTILQPNVTKCTLSFCFWVLTKSFTLFEGHVLQNICFSCR
jgi:hypothetical protein